MRCPLCGLIIGPIALMGVTVYAGCACTKEALAARILDLEAQVLIDRAAMSCDDGLGRDPDACAVCAAYVAGIALVPDR